MSRGIALTRVNDFPFGQFLFAALIALAILFATGCSRPGAESKATRSDAEIIGDVVTRIQGNPQFAGKPFSVLSNQGVVTINGTASNDTERTQVASIAAQVPGVKTVINDVVIDMPAAQQPAEMAQEQLPEKKSEPTPDKTVATRSKPSARHAAAAKEPNVAEDKVTRTASQTSTQATNSNLPIVYNGGGSNAAIGSVPSIPSAPVAKPIQLVRVDAGTQLAIRLVDSIDSGVNNAGDTFRATLDSPVMVDGEVVLPQGASVVGRIIDSKDAGRLAGRAEMALELQSISVGNRRYMIRTNQHTLQGGSQTARTAKTVGSGAAIGAIIGAIAGGGKGAAIGAAVGAGAGGGVTAARRPQQAHLGSEARLTFRLENPISVAPVSSTERGYTNTANSTNTSTGSTTSDPFPDSATDNQGPAKVYNDDEPSEGDRPVLKRRPPPSQEPQ
jgi:outer membrane lipoprotein SlyB